VSLISPVNRARLLRLARTFHEVHAETGSLPRSIAHSARFIGKKIIPLARYRYPRSLDYSLSGGSVRRTHSGFPIVPFLNIHSGGSVITS